LALEFSARLEFNSFNQGFRCDMKMTNQVRWRLSEIVSSVPGILKKDEEP